MLVNSRVAERLAAPKEGLSVMELIFQYSFVLLALLLLSRKLIE
jgi:hypothetical protein